MILVTTGISGAPFDRLLHAVDRFETDEPIVVQHGPSLVRPEGTTCIPFLPFPELSELADSASMVVTHAGAGSVLVALTFGKRPIVVPRRPEFSELVDDHQIVFARHLAQCDLVVLVEDPVDLPRIVAAGPPTPLPRNGRRSALVGELSVYLGSLQRSG